MHLEHLILLSQELGVSDIAKVVLENDKFSYWTGSGDATKHHYGKFGLVTHTREVVDLCLKNTEYFQDQYAIDKQKLYLAALFHDIGKVYDYELIIKDPACWRKSTHARQTHHITRSALIWNEAKNKYNFPDVEDEVLHAILSHHGRREYGSPVSPNTRLAWTLHLCDSISARLNDYGTHDGSKV